MERIIHTTATFLRLSLDLSGAVANIFAYYAVKPGVLVGYDLVYTQASSGDAGVAVRIGKISAGSLDDDYFHTSISEASKVLGYSKTFISVDLSNTEIAAGDAITVGTAGGKVGTGEVRVVLKVVECG